ncbi:MAG: DUF423 domain-containing protein [Gammaproteobacteria bacterium]|nr:DUF423 domain-containing protein [Gammaproteobacteria bacterium]
MSNRLIATGAILAFTAVALGAFGAHGLKQHLEANLLEIYQTAVLYHMVHALGVVLIGIIWQQRLDDARLRWSGVSLALGTLIFSGSLYLLAISGLRWLGAITPLGGVLFLIGWGLLAAAMIRPRK